MSDKKSKSKIESFLIKFLGCVFGSLIISLFLAIVLSCLIDYQTISIDALANSFSSTSFITTLGISLLGCALFCLLYFTKGSKDKKEMKGKEDLENQRFLTPDEMDAKLKVCHWNELKNFKYEGWPLCSKIHGGKFKIQFCQNYHMLVIGSTGSGKTETIIIPTIQILAKTKNKPSMFITDTKGELFAQNSQLLIDEGYDVKVIDLTDPYRSIQWNPLESIYDNFQKSNHLKEEVLVHTNDDVSNYKLIKVGDISPEKWYEFAGKAFATLEQTLAEIEVERNKLIDSCFADLNDIANALCPIESSKDPSWEQGARDYILAILIAMLEDSENPDLGMTRDKYNFYNMYKLAMNKENGFEVMQNYFKGRSQLSKTRQLSNHITDTKAQQTRDSFMSTIATKLNMFSDNGINYLTCKNDINFYDFDEKPTALFVKIPDENKSRYTLASICVGQAYKEFVRKARDNEFSKGQASLARPLHYIMDEFANLPPISNIGTMITVSRSRRIYFEMVIQSYSQLETAYGKDIANTIRGNCNGEIYIGTPDQYTREEFSKKLGNYTIKVDNKSTSKGADGKDQNTIGTSYQTRPLVYPADLAHLQKGHFYAYIYTLYPIEGYMESKYTEAKKFFNLKKMDEPFVPGKRLPEERIFYDPKDRNKKVLGY